MTRTKTIATLWCTALAAALAAYGCGSSSTIDTGMGGSSGGAGKTGSGTGGGIVIINTGGMTGSGGMTGGAGMAGGMGGMMAVDAGPPMCAPNAMCTAPFMCDGTCMRMGQAGTRTCMCGMNGRLACGACVTPDAGPPPPVDAAPRPDAGPACPNGARNNGPCVLGTSPSPCSRMVGGGGTQTCTCADVPDAGVDGAAVARYTCM